MKFVSARDDMYNGIFWVMFILIGGLVIMTLLIPSSKADTLMAIFGLVPVLAGMIFIYARTYYVVSDEYLIIHFGPFRQTLQRDRIFSIKSYRSIYSAPALSRARLQVRYDKFGEVQVSPQDRPGFLAALGFSPEPE